MADKPELPNRFTDSMVVDILHPSQVTAPSFKAGYKTALAGKPANEKKLQDVVWKCGYEAGVAERAHPTKKRATEP